MRNEIKFKRAMVGTLSGRLKVVSYNRWEKSHYWNCICECGRGAVVREISLINGKTKSCGCLQREAARANRSPVTHGLSRSSEYASFQKMHSRCNNKNNNRFDRYGDRGIKVLWKSFDEFYFDMGPKPSPNHSIDRIDNNGHYCKENCRWGTPSEQANNRSSARKITFHGEELSLTDWSRKLGVAVSTLFNRLNRGLELEMVFAQRDYRSGKLYQN